MARGGPGGGAAFRVCFVCLGNICRSPTAEGIFRHLVREAGLEALFAIDSAGTGEWHAGEPPDRRATATAKRRGVTLEGAARQFRRGDFARFDLVIAMDRENRDELARMAPDEAAHAKVALLRDFDPEAPDGADVPDPYYGGARGFDDVFDLCTAACRGLLAQVREERGLG